MGRCAAAEKERLNVPRLPKPRQLRLQRSAVIVDAIVLTDGDGEIAVAAVMGAERHVDVGGTGPEPGGFAGHVRYTIGRGMPRTRRPIVAAMLGGLAARSRNPVHGSAVAEAAIPAGEGPALGRDRGPA